MHRLYKEILGQHDSDILSEKNQCNRSIKLRAPGSPTPLSSLAKVSFREPTTGKFIPGTDWDCKISDVEALFKISRCKVLFPTFFDKMNCRIVVSHGLPESLAAPGDSHALVEVVRAWRWIHDLDLGIHLEHQSKQCAWNNVFFGRYSGVSVCTYLSLLIMLEGLVVDGLVVIHVAGNLQANDAVLVDDSVEMGCPWADLTICASTTSLWKKVLWLV